MTVRTLISELLDKCQNLDSKVELGISVKTDVVSKYLELSKDKVWCLDEFLEIDEVDYTGDRIWIRAEELS